MVRSPLNLVKGLWKSWALSECKVFLWLVILNKCWAADRLARGGLAHSSNVRHVIRRNLPNVSSPLVCLLIDFWYNVLNISSSIVWLAIKNKCWSASRLAKGGLAYSSHVCHVIRRNLPNISSPIVCLLVNFWCNLQAQLGLDRVAPRRNELSFADWWRKAS